MVLFTATKYRPRIRWTNFLRSLSCVSFLSKWTFFITAHDTKVKKWIKIGLHSFQLESRGDLCIQYTFVAHPSIHSINSPKIELSDPRSLIIDMFDYSTCFFKYLTSHFHVNHYRWDIRQKKKMETNSAILKTLSSGLLWIFHISAPSRPSWRCMTEKTLETKQVREFILFFCFIFTPTFATLNISCLRWVEVIKETTS